MFLYNFTLKPSSLPLASLVGQFGKKQQLVVATPTTLETYVQGEEALEKLHVQFSFGIIQKLGILKPIGFEKDLLVITSDSGNLTICELKDLGFEPIIQEPHSKNGLRSLTPGEYLDIDPKNRAIMISATERRKLVYRVHVENGVVSLSSPLEAPIAKGFTISTCSVDNGFDNPLFAAIETNGAGLVLSYYELDQGLNHVVRRSESVDASASLVIPFDGVIVCCEGFIIHKGKQISLPKKCHIVSYVVHKIKADFFILLQSEHGDLFKLDGEKVSFYGQLPVCASINVFKNGYLYANVMNGNKLYCQITGLEVSDTPKELDNLELISTLETLDPILDMKFKDNQLITANLGAVKTLIHGVPTTTVVESPLPTTPTKIFTTKLNRDDVNDSYLVITSNETTVLSIGEVVEEVTDSNFSKEPTIFVQQLGKLALAQVYSNGIKHINNGKITDWFPPGGINIIRAAGNNQQLVIGLTNNEIVYFEVDTDDQLIEYQDKLEVSTSITALGLARDFAVIGCADETIQVISLKQHNCLEILSLQMLSSNSTCIEFFGQEVHIGMENGLFVRTTIDVKGKLSNTRVKYLGTKPVKLSMLNGMILAISSKPWVGFNSNGNFKLAPLNDVDVLDGTSFYSEDIGGEGIVGFKGSDLVIFTIDELRNDFIVNTEELSTRKIFLDDGVYTVGNQLIKNNDIKHDISGVPLSICRFKEYIVVGVTKPNAIYTFKDMELLHKTEVDKPPRALIQFEDKLLVGMDNLLRTYDLGQKQLLRKSSQTLPQLNLIVKIIHQGKNRIVIGDSKSSTVFCKIVDDIIIPVADDTMSRQVTALETLDFDTVIGGDKFGNLFVNRVNQDNELFVEDLFLNGSSGRCQTLAQFYLNDIPMAFSKGVMVIGGPEVIIYCGLMGTIGILMPISERDFELLKTLEGELNDIDSSLLGRDHMKFRSYYNMTNNVIDGDLIETYFTLKVSKKMAIANKLKRPVREIENKINDFRDKAAF